MAGRSIIQGVEDKEASDFYYGKRIAYIYKVKRCCEFGQLQSVAYVGYDRVARGIPRSRTGRIPSWSSVHHVYNRRPVVSRQYSRRFYGCFFYGLSFELCCHICPPPPPPPSRRINSHTAGYQCCIINKSSNRKVLKPTAVGGCFLFRCWAGRRYPVLAMVPAATGSRNFK